jgi:hypothetical protein
MPRGPKGEKRPPDVIGTAVMVGRIATGEVQDRSSVISPNRAKGGLKGGKARAKKLSVKERKDIATKAALARWKKL